jgi:Mce-associated membrane protein
MEGDAGTSRLIPTIGDAESTEADGAVMTEPVERRPSRLGSRAWVVGVCAALVVLSVALAGGGYFALRSHRESVALARTEAAAIQAAKDCVSATQAPDINAILASQRKIIDCATGGFGAQAALYSGVLVDAYQASKAQVQVSDLRAAVERHNPDGSINVLVALRIKLSNTAAQDQDIGYRLRVEMAPDNGTYKIARLDQVTK